MDLYRFYVPDLQNQLQPGLLVTLPPDQGHHARAVLRLVAGDAVILFDGNGAWVQATLGQVGKSSVTALAAGPATLDAATPLRLTLATAVPKGDRAEWLIEQASQLNVGAVQWLESDRSVVKPREGGGKIEKWRRLAIESAKQCGRTHVMQVHPPAKLEAVLQSAGKPKILWLHPGEGGKKVTAALAGMQGGDVIALIGPEGGWSDEEQTLLQSAALSGMLERVRLTSSVLRIETACAALAALVMAG